MGWGDRQHPIGTEGTFPHRIDGMASTETVGRHGGSAAVNTSRIRFARPGASHAVEFRPARFRPIRPASSGAFNGIGEASAIAGVVNVERRRDAAALRVSVGRGFNYV